MHAGEAGPNAVWSGAIRPGAYPSSLTGEASLGAAGGASA